VIAGFTGIAASNPVLLAVPQPAVFPLCSVALKQLPSSTGKISF
jgi:hypothetical protein